MTLPTLQSLYAEHTGKVADKWSAYLREYDRILGKYREKPIRLLEIGVQNGGSLELWSRFFPTAEKLVGCDINPDCERLTYDDTRVTVVVGDANNDETQRSIVQQSRAFDIIIDDGSHRSSSIVQSFARYFPLLADDGVYIVEDLHCSYWSEFEGGLFYPYSSMSFLKRLADVVNHEHWGVSRFRTEAVKGILAHWGATIHEHDLARVHSVEFTNSVCVVRKMATDSNALGTRLIVGIEEPVLEGILGKQAMLRPEALDQTGNHWSTSARPGEEELPIVKHEFAAMQEQLAALEQERPQLAAEAAAATSLRADVDRLTRDEERWKKALYERDRKLSEVATLLAEFDSTRRQYETQFVRERAENQRLRDELGAAQKQISKVQSSLAWKVTMPLRKVAGAIDRVGPPGGLQLATRRVRKVLRKQGVSGATRRFVQIATGQAGLAPVPGSRPGPDPVAADMAARGNYHEWLRKYDFVTREHCAALQVRAERFAKKPLISVIVPTYNPNLRWLAEAIDSVRAQAYPHWELCLVDDASPNTEVRPFLQNYANMDPRIKVRFREQNGHISLATNDGFEMAQGEWIALLDHDDVLREHALFWVADAINSKEGVKLIYSDEDKLLPSGERFGPYFKTDWNPDLFLSHNMICHLAVYRADLVRAVGGCRQGFEGAQDYDMALRCVEQLQSTEIHHVPRVLYSWRIHPESTASNGEAKPYAALAGKRALDEHFARRGIRATAELRPDVSYRTRYALPEVEPLVSIIIPTRNAEQLVKQCVESIVRRTAYSRYEILLIDNGSDDPKAVSYFRALEREGTIRVLRDERPFNYSALNNAGVRAASGELICLMNNDIEVISRDWLSEMVSLAVQPGVGAVGARLWYPNDTLQHGGVILGIGGVAGHAHKGSPRGNRGYYGRADIIQGFSAVTAACLLIRKEAFLEVGGLDEVNLQIAFNDVDFCLRLLEAGYRNLWTPYADLYHHESATRGYENTPEKVARFEREIRYMKGRWAGILKADPAYNPNLSATHEDFTWAWPPRLPEVFGIA